jgi:hypothetical protein
MRNCQVKSFPTISPTTPLTRRFWNLTIMEGNLYENHEWLKNLSITSWFSIMLIIRIKPWQLGQVRGATLYIFRINLTQFRLVWHSPLVLWHRGWGYLDFPFDEAPVKHCYKKSLSKNNRRSGENP